QTRAALALAMQNPSPKPLELPEPEVQVQEPVQEEKQPQEIEKLQPGLYLAAQGQAVESLQRVLFELNLYHQSITGNYDEATEAAVFELQKTKGVVAAPAARGAGVYGPTTHETVQLTLGERAEKSRDYPREVQGCVPKREKLPMLSELTLSGEAHLPMV